MTDKGTSGQSVLKSPELPEGLFLMDGIEGLRSLFAVGFQGLLILVCVAIYAVLIQGIATGGDPIGAIWGTVGYTVLLCFMLFKTGTIARSIFSAH